MGSCMHPRKTDAGKLVPTKKVIGSNGSSRRSIARPVFGGFATLRRRNWKKEEIKTAKGVE